MWLLRPGSDLKPLLVKYPIKPGSIKPFLVKRADGLSKIYCGFLLLILFSDLVALSAY